VQGCILHSVVVWSRWQFLKTYEGGQLTCDIVHPVSIPNHLTTHFPV
jgi:hypothetical protein